MNQEHANRIIEILPDEAVVVDVGGGMAAFPRADWIVDAISFDEQGCLLKSRGEQSPSRFTRDTWVQIDLCDRQPWPFEDNQFDFAVCSHVLEDVRDPVWLCSEMSRIARAGYIETPSRMIEQSKGVEHPCYAGYYHHRWLVSEQLGKLEFRHKPHLLHTTADAIVGYAGVFKKINPEYEILAHYWENVIACQEILEFDEEAVVDELCAWSRQARQSKDIVVPYPASWKNRLRKASYFTRLRLSRR